MMDKKHQKFDFIFTEIVQDHIKEKQNKSN